MTNHNHNSYTRESLTRSEHNVIYNQYGATSFEGLSLAPFWDAFKSILEALVSG